MSARQSGPYDSVARKWLALTQRRKADLIEIRNSGRWIHYFTQPQFDDEMRKIDRLCEQWAAIAGIARRPGE